MFYMNIIERIVYIALLVLLIIIAIKALPVLGALIRFLTAMLDSMTITLR
jgi:hypothetical protein